MAGFVLKKVLEAFLFPPGLFILLLVGLAVLTKKRTRFLVLGVALVIYAASVEPTRNILIMPLEDAYPVPSAQELASCDALVVLGSGIYERATREGVKTVLSDEAIARSVAAYRLHTSSGKPIIYTGGGLYGRKAEADVAEPFFLSLGVPTRSFVKESKSVDTLGNARLTADICRQRGFRRIALVTSSYHMPRSVYLFRRFFEDVVPYPVGFVTSTSRYTMYTFLPSAASLCVTWTALKERSGLVWYHLRPPR